MPKRIFSAEIIHRNGDNYAQKMERGLFMASDAVIDGASSCHVLFHVDRMVRLRSLQNAGEGNRPGRRGACGAHAGDLFLRERGTGPGRYGRQNLRVILQRASALVILALLHLHVKAFGFIVSGASLSGADKAFLLITELLFFGAVSLHLGVSFSRSLITMGLLSSDAGEKRTDRAAWAISALLMAVSAAALVKFVVSWTGFGG